MYRRDSVVLPPAQLEKTEKMNISSPLMASSSEDSARDRGGDPYYAFKEELESQVEDISSKFTMWKKMSMTTVDYSKKTKILLRQITSAQNQLPFLEHMVQRVEKRPSDFPHIDPTELHTRQAFVSKMKQNIHDMLLSVQSTASKLNRTELITTQQQQSSHSSSRPNNAEFLHSQQQRQQELMHEQDENLDELGKSVAHLGAVAVGINTEIDVQNKMLEEMGHDIDETQERMNFVMGRMSKLLKTKDTCQLGSIVILTVILVIMVFLVLYT